MNEELETRYFTLSIPMYGYRSAVRQWGNSYQLQPQKVYEAVHVASSHLEVRHPTKPDQVLYLPLKSAWWWERVQLAPSDEALFVLLGGSR